MKRRIAFFSAAFIIIIFALNVWLRAIYVVPILMYHSIDTKINEEYKALIVTPENFKRQMEFLKNNRYNVISLGEFSEILNSKKKAPGKTLCVTFDDGYEDNYKYAYPVLKRLGLPAAIFICTNSIDKPGFLTSKEIREMSDGGLDIGGHTKAHFWLGKSESGIDLRRAKEEIIESKNILEGLTGRKVDFFCYPGGGFTRQTRQLVIDAGYKAAAATNPGRKYPKHDVYALKRLRISSNCNNLFIFWIETSGYYTWLKEHRDKD